MLGAGELPKTTSGKLQPFLAPFGSVVALARELGCQPDFRVGEERMYSSLVLHDPTHDLTIAVISNTISTSLLRAERIKPFIPAIYADLGL